MVDNQENILVELDYDNISLIDPNKVIDEQGNVKDRLVKQEDLVYYANLECNVLPRTKLAVGSAMNDSQRTISVAKINFLNPGNKPFMDTAWSDELTGKGTLEGKGVNQPRQTAVKNPNQTNDYYITQNLFSNGTPGAVDNGFLGMKSIKMSIGTDFLPQIDVELEDIKGRALFESGNNSPYAAFFQLPYPQFTLTLKGYYGKAIKFPIMLQSFTSTFDPGTHNFQIRLKFYGYKYTLLSYVNFGALMAVPQMYRNNVTQTPVSKTQGNQQSSSDTLATTLSVSRGYQKMREVYSDYKSKGLIPDDFPEITLNQLKYRLQKFIDDVLSQFEKENMGVLSDMSLYTNNLLAYQQKIFLYANASWYGTFMDRDNPIVLKQNSQNVYIFKKELDVNKRSEGVTKLKGDIDQYNDVLNQNGVFGINGKYTIGGITTKSNIDVPISLEKLQKKITISDIDFVKTYTAQKNAPKGNYKESDSVIIQFKQTLQSQLLVNDNITYFFEGPKSFMDITDNIAKTASETRKKVETEITASLSSKFNSQGNGGLGFIPSVRNVLAVFYCQGETFLRLLDEVHKKAWDQRENQYRRASIFGNTSTAPSVDLKTSTQNNEPIYPWPQVLKESVGEDNKEKFEIIYPGDQTVANTYRAYSPEVWPEVEFVEQFIKGFTERQLNNNDSKVFETNLKPLRISLNAIDFPTTNQIFQNKEESKYFYEIYERLLLNSFYSNFNRKSGYPLAMYEVESEDEAINILQSLGNDNPFLSKILKEYLLDSNNYVSFLKHISNEGQGESWQTYIRGEFVTPYIKNEVINPNRIINNEIFNSLKSQPDVSLSSPKNLANIDKYLTGSSASNEFDFIDTYPLVDLNWNKNNLADGKSLNNAKEAFDTKQVIQYNNIHKTITNFALSTTVNDIRPFTYFNFQNLNVTPDTTNLKTFYNTRTYSNQLITEGNLYYSNYSNYLDASQTTSMLNTPYFINAIQKGVFNFRYKQTDLAPYKLGAYLFLNSLPLATLREKYKTNSGQATTDLDYILSTMKKFGAVHKLPYSWILKYGSIWHRYKIYKETGVDILDEVWQDFNYKKNWDPANSATTYTYNLTIDGTPRNLVLDNTTGTPPLTDINTGFYPQLIDDFNVFLQGLKLFSGQTQVSGSCVSQNITGTCETFQVTGTCSTNGTGITINSISKNYIKVPHTIYLPSLNANIQLVSQVSGTTGGTGYYTTPLNFNAAFTGLDFVLGAFSNVKNSNPNSIKVGQILGKPSSTSGITILNIISASTTFVTQTTTPPIPFLLDDQASLYPPPPNYQGNPVEITTLLISNLSYTVVIYSWGPRKYAVLRDQNQNVLLVGGLASSVDTTNEQLRQEIVYAYFNSIVSNPNNPQFVQSVESITPQTQANNPQSATTITNFLCEVSSANTETFNYTVLNPPLQITAVESNVISGGTILNGPNLNGNIEISSQISGTTGGIGLYNIKNVQPPTTSSFVVQGAFIQGIGSPQIQNLINNEKLVLLNTTNSTIFELPGFDPNSITRSMRVSPWSVIVSSSTQPDFYYVLPSFGSNVNQAKEEAFKNGTMKVELSNNPAMFNGTVRLFWNVPQYGWFDNSKLKKNNPETYLKKILNEQKDQQNFLITGNDTEYTNIEELFTTFDISVLDNFESEFLNFSRSLYDYVDTLPNPISQQEKTKTSQGEITSDSNTEKGYKNFHYLMRQLLVINKPSGDSPETRLENIISNQNETFQQILGGFINYDVCFKFGNPSNFDRRLFYTFSTRYIEDPIIYGPYEQGNLPPQVSLSQSKQQNPKTWEALEYYVGNSSIPKLKYSNNGSYITDFFIDLNVLFNEKNVQDFAPIIKIYATQKLANNNLNLNSFYKLMDAYIDDSNKYVGNVLNTMLPAVRKQLPNIFISEDGSANRADLEAGFTEQTRTELWETFKALNDTWIAGFDFQNKTLFEDVMLVDRASRNVGDKVLVDIYGIINLLEDGSTEKNKGSSSYKNTLLDMVTTILVENNFQHFMLPAYVNFYNVQDAQKNPTPRPDGTMEFGNMLFGTFLNVDYRQSSPKFLCYYVSKPSEHLNMNNNIDYRFRDDAFDLRRASDNPLIENQATKIDWDKSNKVVGFNVDPTKENQQIFKSFSVSQDPGKPTSESLQILDQMANVEKNRRSSTQSVSLFNLYKNRSYSCSVDMMGCALIQPMMYFNIRNIPMFSGPYMITKVSHDVSENGFNTVFEGIRQPFYSLPTVDNFLQTLNVKILSQLQSKIQENESKQKQDSVNVLFQAQNTIANLQSQDTLTKNQDCANQLNSRYNNFTGVDTPQPTSISVKTFLNELRNILIELKYDMTGDTTYQTAASVFTFVFVDSGNNNGTELSAYENNYSTINLQEVYGDTFFEFINRKYFCVSRGTDKNLPIVAFRSLKDFIKFVLLKVGNIPTFLNQDESKFSQYGDKSPPYNLAKQYVLHYPINQNADVYTKIEADNNQIESLRSEFLKAYQIFESLWS